MSDKNVENVVTQLRDREEEGLIKYGVNTERKDLSTLEWLQHLQEELMDASVYIEKLKNEMKETRVVMGVCFGEREHREKSVSAPCSRTALVRDRYIDDIKSGMKTERFEKVDEKEWDKVVQRMKDKERNRIRPEWE